MAMEARDERPQETVAKRHRCISKRPWNLSSICRPSVRNAGLSPRKRFAKSERRMDRMERMVGQNNRLVALLARAGVTLRSDAGPHERAITRIEENLAEATDKLNGLIDIVD